jgi:preprotein translocase subunit SecA
MIENAQEKVEKHNFEIRKNLIEYDDVLNQHRLVIYKFRRTILDKKDDSHEIISDMICQVASNVINKICLEKDVNKEQVQQVFHLLSSITSIPEAELNDAKININNSQIFESELKDYLVDQYNLYRSENKERMQEIERWLILETIDKGWNQHMLNIDHLKEGINLRSWGQKNPLIEYKREAFLTFQDMLTSIKWEIVHHVFHLNVENFNQQELMKKREIDFAKINLNMPEDKVEKITKSKK